MAAVIISFIRRGKSKTDGVEGTATSVWPWDEFVHWAKRFYEWDEFEEVEREYKVEIAAELSAVKEPFLKQLPDREKELERSLHRPSAKNLVDWRAIDNFLKLGQAQREMGLHGIWGNPNSASLEQRIRHFLEICSAELQGRGVSFAPLTSLMSLLLMADGAEQHPIYGYSTLRKAAQLTGTAPDANDSRDLWERYQHMSAFTIR